VCRPGPGHPDRPHRTQRDHRTDRLAPLGLPTGTCAADRAYTGCSPENTVPADAGGDLKTAKFRQDIPCLSTAWIAAYKPIRSHNEGIHGRLKSDEIDIGNPKHRPAPGQVAQNLLVALLVTAGNLDILETWLYQRTGRRLTDTSFFGDTGDARPAPETRTVPPAQTGRPPPEPDCRH